MAANISNADTLKLPYLVVHNTFFGRAMSMSIRNDCVLVDFEKYMDHVAMSKRLRSNEIKIVNFYKILKTYIKMKEQSGSATLAWGKI